MDIPPAPSILFDSHMQLSSGATAAPGEPTQGVGGAGGAVGASHTEPPDSAANFPYGPNLPKTNVPVAPTGGGMISRDQRLRELNVFTLTKYNQLGRRVEENCETLNGLLKDPSLRLEKRRRKRAGEEGEEEEDEKHEDSEEALVRARPGLEPSIVVTDSAPTSHAH